VSARRTLLRLAPWLAAAALLGAVFLRVDFGATSRALGSADWPRFLAAAVPFAFVWLAIDAAALSRLVTRFHAPLAWREMLRLRGATYLLLVLSYDAAQAALALALSRRLGVPLLALGGTFLFWYAIDLATIAALGSLGALALPSALGAALRPALAGLFVLVASALAGGAWLARAGRSRVGAVARLVLRLVRRVRRRHAARVRHPRPAAGAARVRAGHALALGASDHGRGPRLHAGGDARALRRLRGRGLDRRVLARARRVPRRAALADRARVLARAHGRARGGPCLRRKESHMRMSRRSLAWSLALLLPMFGSGCFTVHHAYHGDKRITNGPGLERPTKVVRHFEASDRQFFWLHGFVPTGEPLNGLALAAAQAGDDPGVVNLKLKEGQNFTDLVITHVPCILGFVCGTWSTWVEGDVVEYIDAADGR
jgi:hypothetical protein